MPLSVTPSGHSWTVYSTKLAFIGLTSDVKIICQEKRADCKKAQADAEWWLRYCYVMAMILVVYNSRICEVNNAKMSKRAFVPKRPFKFLIYSPNKSQARQ